MKNDLLVIIVGFLLLVVLLLWLNLAGMTAQRDEARAEVAKLKAEIVLVEVSARRKAMELELQYTQSMQALATQLKQEMDDADEVHTRVVADLEHGTLQLREHWRGCEARLDNLSAAAGATADLDAATRLRIEGAADIVRIGTECDAKLRAWQSYARSVMGRE